MEMTMKLVKKDFIHLGCSLKNLLVMWVVLCTCLPVANLGFAIVMPALGAYITLNSMRSYEERNKGDFLTGALPVTRTQMCQAQYIEVLLYIIGGMILSTIGLGIKMLESDVQIAIWPAMSLMGIIGLIYTGIILPIILYFGVAKAKYVLMITYIIVFVGAFNMNAVAPEILNGVIEKVNGSIIGTISFLIAIIIWAVSYSISLVIFQNKDFK